MPSASTEVSDGGTDAEMGAGMEVLACFNRSFSVKRISAWVDTRRLRLGGALGADSLPERRLAESILRERLRRERLRCF